MFLDFFTKKYDIFFSDKEGVYKDSLSKDKINQLSIEENVWKKEVIENIIDNIYFNLKKITKKDLTTYNIKKLDFLNEQIILLKNSLDSINLNRLNNKSREIFKNFITLITSQSWQSPDYGYNIHQQHGITQKKIYSFYNDYQRYRTDSKEIEDLLSSEYTNILEVNKKAYLFNSGMSAFLCLINSFKNFDNKLKIASKNLYFEIDSFLKYQENIKFFNNENFDQIISCIKKNQPHYLFFDLLPNTPKLKIFKLKNLFDYYINNPTSQEINIIIDTTLNFINFDISMYFDNNFPPNLNIFLYRSLQKLDQYGLDIVSSGLLVHYGNSKLNIDGIRQMGFTATEEQCLTLKLFPRDHLNYRFKIICRNSLLIAKYLSNLKNDTLEHVYHPLLEVNVKNKEYSLEKNINLTDSINIKDSPLFYLKLNSYFNLEDNNIFIKEFLDICKSENIPIILGTSFGFNISRLMLISDSENNIFIRFSLGMENISEVLSICNIFENICSKFLEKLMSLYKEGKTDFFKSKLELFDDYMKDIIDNKNIEENIFKIIYLLKDIETNINKFRKNSKTSKYYNEIIENISEKILKPLSTMNDSNLKEFKKEIIRTINNFYS